MVKIKIFDIGIIVLLLALSLTPLVRLLSADSDEASVLIKVGDTVCHYPLNDDREEIIHNNGYTLTVGIYNGSASVISSDCEDRICVHSGSISNAGSAIVCLPADTVIEIISGEEVHDAVAG